MMNSRNFLSMAGGVFAFILLFNGHHLAFAQASGSVPVGDNMPTELTLWQTLKAGGGVMVVIGFLSIAAVAIIIYDFMMLNVNKLAPRKLFEDVMRKLESRDFGAVHYAHGRAASGQAAQRGERQHGYLQAGHRCLPAALARHLNGISSSSTQPGRCPCAADC